MNQNNLNDSIFLELFSVIKNRIKESNPTDSYTSSLFKGGKDKILKKIGEEITELIIASKNNSKDNLVHEICDVHYHILVLMLIHNIDFLEIENELSKRFAMSGFEEKKNRDKFTN